jgi:isoquinoline 1-oxidoreductase beta subunit
MRARFGLPPRTEPVHTIVLPSRRQFLESVFSAGSLVLGAQALARDASAAESAGPGWRPSVYLGIEPDGRVVIVAHRSEMGQGVRTSLPMIVADELDADWNRVSIEQAPGDPRYGRQDTDGSRSTRDFFVPLREAGATARLMLIRAASQQWSVPASECDTEMHAVFHRATGRRAAYGELVPAAAKLPVPHKADVRLKPKEKWRYIGKGVTSKDAPAMCNGTAVFGMDVRLDDMVYTSIERPPVFGGKVKSYDDKEALAVPGVLETVLIDPFKPPAGFQPLGGVAVIATNTWAAQQGREKLKIVWEHGVNETYNSEAYKKELQETVHKPCKAVRDEGNVDSDFEKGGKIVEADYYVPHLSQAPMEPMVAVADFRDGRITVIAPTQDPQGVQDLLSELLGIPKENVSCQIALLGGAFGRKDHLDFIAEAAVLAKKTGRRVKVVWTQPDNIKAGYFNAVCAMYMKAALNNSGRPTAWLQRSCFPPIPSTFQLNAVYGDAGHLGQGWTDVPFEIPNLRAENGPAEAHVRIGWMRSVAGIYQVFAVQCFADELAHAAGRDPLEYLLELIGKPRILDLKKTSYENYGAPYDVYPIDTGRLRRVTELAAAKAGWGKRKLRKGSGMGIAANQNSLTYVATVVEVEVSDQGRIRIPRVDMAVDAGMIINPDMARAQLEGAAVFGASIALRGEITATRGMIDQSNYHDYPIARMSDAPLQTNVHFVESDAKPTGVAEPGVPPFIAAFCNAIFAATGKRIRELPIGKQKLV